MLISIWIYGELITHVSISRSLFMDKSLDDLSIEFLTIGSGLW